MPQATNKSLQLGLPVSITYNNKSMEPLKENSTHRITLVLLADRT